MANKKKLPKPLVNFKGFLKDKGTFPAVNKKEVAKKLLKQGFRMTLGRTAQGAGIALVGGSIASMVANKMKKKKNAMKNMKDVSKNNLPKKKMGGGMMKKPMGYDKGGPSFNHELDHPHVQGLKKMINKNRKEKSKLFLNKMFTKVGLIAKSKNKPITDQEAKKLADRLRTKAIKRTSATEGSFSTGGEAKVRGMGAAIKGGKFQGVF